MNNSVYGKTMKNLRQRVKVRLVNNTKDNKKWVSRPSFVSQKILNRNFVAIYEIRPVSTLDKLIYVGFIILDLSKLLMYEFIFHYIRVKYGCDAKLLFTDTHSLVFEIKTNDVYEDFYRDSGLFDFSNYPEDSRFYDPVNKKDIGKMIKIKDLFFGLGR